MNSHSDKLRDLLADVMPTDSRCGPSRAAVLEMAGHERVRRRQARVIVATAAAALLALPFLWRSAPHQESPAVAAPVASPQIVIHQVDDQQLLALLQDKPVALMEWPNGRRTLLVMEH